jgi:hypothetical protein
VHKSKRKNVIKMSAATMKEADLLKLKKGKAKKPTDEEAKKKEADSVHEEKSDEPMKKEVPAADQAEEKKEIKYLELSPNEERDAKQKIYMQVYDE